VSPKPPSPHDLNETVASAVLAIDTVQTAAGLNYERSECALDWMVGSLIAHGLNSSEGTPPHPYGGWLQRGMKRGRRKGGGKGTEGRRAPPILLKHMGSQVLRALGTAMPVEYPKKAFVVRWVTFIFAGRR